MNKAFFIDKDGTLVDNSGYPDIIPSDELLENDVLDGLKHIQNKGYKLIIISNQPWISKGRLTKEDTDIIFESLIDKLSVHGIKIDDYIYCPHSSADGCDCKKPSPKMILETARRNNIDLNQSYMVGDSENDVLAGKNAGIKTILVRTGQGKDCAEKMHNIADKILNNLNGLIVDG